MSPGERDLTRLLASLSPLLDPEEYGFGLLPPEAPLPLAPLALFREAEGTTLIAPAQDLARAGVPHVAGWARITLMVHSSLAAVGMTAAVAQALTSAGIPANMVAAYHHDHLFVPWAQRQAARDVLDRLAAAARA